MAAMLTINLHPIREHCRHRRPQIQQINHPVLRPGLGGHTISRAMDVTIASSEG